MDVMQRRRVLGSARIWRAMADWRWGGGRRAMVDE
jgi:hypothetical protein